MSTKEETGKAKRKHWLKDIRLAWFLALSGLASFVLVAGAQTLNANSLNVASAMTVTLTSPSVSGAVLSGSGFSLGALTSPAAASLDFMLSPSGGGNAITFRSDSPSGSSSWSAVADVSWIADGSYRLSAVASGANGTQTTSSVLDVSVQNTASATATATTQTFVVTVNHPTDGATFDKPQVALSATTSAAASGLRFLISSSSTAATATNSPVSVQASFDATVNGWVATFNAPANGTYSLTAEAFPVVPTGTTAQSVRTQTATLFTVAEPPPSLSLTEPVATSFFTGTDVGLAGSSTVLFASSVGFQAVFERNSTVDIAATCVSGSQCQRWRAVWHPSRAGQYAIRAVARYGNANQPYFSPSSAVSVTDATVVPSISVSMTSPSGDPAVGILRVRLGATTTVPAANLNFAVSDSNGTLVASPRAATADATGQNWSVDWTAPNYGSYSVYANALPVGSTVTTQAARSSSVTFRLTPPSDTLPVSAPPKVTLLAPSAVASLAVQTAVRLYASTDAVNPSTLGFLVRPLAENAPQILKIDCGAVGCPAVWSNYWTPTSVGQYVLTAFVRPAGATTDVFSEPRTVTVGEAQIATPTFSVHVTGPTSNPAAGVRDVTLSATTNIRASYLDFILTPKTSGASPIRVRNAVADAAGLNWTAKWSAATADTYAVTAASSYVGASAAFQATSDNRLVFSVTLSATPAPAPSSKPAITLISPGSGALPTVNAAVRLYASSDVADPETAGFLVLPPGATSAQPVGPSVCVNSTHCRFWSFDWIPTVAGQYVLSAFVRPVGATSDILSERRTISVGESTASTALAVSVGQPTGGATLKTRSVSLSAKTGAPASKLGFVVRPQAVGAAAYPGVSASSDLAKTGWTAVWLAPADGTYEVFAEALAADLTVTGSVNRSLPVVFSVFAATTDATKPPPALAPTIFLVKPTRETAAAVGRTVGLSATTDIVDAAVQFVIKSSDGNFKTVEATCAPNSSCRVREGSWIPALPGNYAIFARAHFPGETGNRDSAPISLMVTDAPAPLPSVTPATTDAVTAPPVSTEPLAITILQPVGPTVGGSLAVSFRTKGTVQSVKWSVYPGGGNQPLFTRLAVRLPDGTWSGLWNTKEMPNGRYLLVGAAIGTVTETPATARRELGVQNETLTIQPPVAGTLAGQSGEPPAAPLPTSAPTPVIEPIKVIPPEAVMAAVREMPRGAEPFAIDETRSAAPEPAFDPQCQAARIPAAKCHDWLDFRLTPQKCRQLGIITKEECVAYLRDAATEHPAADPCAGKDKEQCTTELDRLTRGMETVDSVRADQATVAEAVGTVLTIEPSAPKKPVPGETADATARTAPPDKVSDMVPLVSRGKLTVRIHASTEFARTEDNGAVRQMPGVVIIDSDGDGLPDDVERRVGTDSQKPDTDGDGYGDFEELKNGYDPLTAGGASGKRYNLAPVDRAVISGVPLEQPRTSGQVRKELKVDDVAVQPASNDGTGGRTRLSGRAVPGQVVTIYVYSYLPVVLTTQADENGNWSYDLDSGMADGRHEAYVTINDESGSIQAKSDPLSFVVNEAKAQTPEDYYNSLPAAEAMTQTPVNRMVNWYLAGAVLAMLLGIGIGVMLVFTRLKKE